MTRKESGPDLLFGNLMKLDWLLLYAPYSPIAVAGLYGLAVHTPLSVPVRYVCNKEFLLGFFEFLAANAAFTALLILVTGQNIEIRAMPMLQKAKFGITFVLCYLIAYNLGKLRNNARANLQTSMMHKRKDQE